MLKRLRIFWTCSLEEGADGYYYHEFNNWLTNDNVSIFAGYNKKSLNKVSSSWKTLKSQFND